KYQDQHVVILGGGDSAVDWALMLEQVAEKVTLIHRREKFRAHEHSIELLHQSTVNIITPYVPNDLEGADYIERLVLQETRGEKLYKLNIDFVHCHFIFVSL